MISIGFKRICTCPDNYQSCIRAKEWAKSQMGVWRFNYETRDIRDKRIHPATFPIALARRVIDLFTHEGELVLDPFVGSGTTLVAAQDANRNAIGFDLQEKYVELAKSRLAANEISLFGSGTQQIAVCDDARNIPKYLEPETVRLIFTSPPYANLLNHQRRNISRRTQERKNYQFMQIEQYSQDPRDLGTMLPEQYVRELVDIFRNLHPLLRKDGHCVINIVDPWQENQRITLHLEVISAMRKCGYELRNIIIWDRTNVVNRIGIFGWPKTYITMGVSFEYLLHFIPNR